MKGKAKVVASISRLACEQGTHLVDPKGQARELLKRKDLHLAADNCLCFCLFFKKLFTFHLCHVHSLLSCLNPLM